VTGVVSRRLRTHHEQLFQRFRQRPTLRVVSAHLGAAPSPRSTRSLVEPFPNCPPGTSDHPERWCLYRHHAGYTTVALRRHRRTRDRGQPLTRFVRRGRPCRYIRTLASGGSFLLPTSRYQRNADPCVERLESDTYDEVLTVPSADPLAKNISAGGGRGQPIITSCRRSFADGRPVEQHHRAQALVTRTARAQIGLSVQGAANPPRRSGTDLRRTSCGRGTASRRPGVRLGQALICRPAISCLSRPAF
jgi:hypothetical protein